MDRLLQQIESELGEDPELAQPSAVTIVDQRDTYVLDSGGLPQIADERPVYPDEMLPSTQRVDLDHDEYFQPGPDVLSGDGPSPRGGYQEKSIFRDDFVDDLRTAAQAAVGPRGEALDDFDQGFQIKKQEYEKLVELAPFVRNNPTSVATAILGGQARVSTDFANAAGVFVRGLATTVIYWAGDDSETTQCTITLVPVDQVSAGAPGGQSLRPVAIIKFGTRGIQCVMEVDIGRGVQVRVSASAVTVDLAMDGGVGAVAGTQTAMDLVGMMSFAASPPSTPPTRSAYFDPLTGAAATAPIPAFAKTVQFVTQDVAVAVRLDFIDASGTVRYSVTQAAAVVLPPIPISGDVAQVTVNRTAGGNSDSALIFQLSA